MDQFMRHLGVSINNICQLTGCLRQRKRKTKPRVVCTGVGMHSCHFPGPICICDLHSPASSFHVVPHLLIASAYLKEHFLCNNSIVRGAKDE